MASLMTVSQEVQQENQGQSGLQRHYHVARTGKASTLREVLEACRCRGEVHQSALRWQVHAHAFCSNAAEAGVHGSAGAGAVDAVSELQRGSLRPQSCASSRCASTMPAQVGMDAGDSAVAATAATAAGSAATGVPCTSK